MSRLAWYCIPFALIFLVGCQGEVQPKVTLGMAKERYMVGEAIPIRLTFSNPSSEGLRIPILPGNIEVFPGNRLQFQSENTGLKPRPVPEGDRHCPDNGLFLAQRVLPGKTWSTVIYLQGFFEEPPPGMYRLPYEVSLVYWIASPEGEKRQELLRSRGELVIIIEGARPHDLIEVFKQYEADLDHPEEGKRQEASECLRFATASEVVPFLVRLLERREHRSEALFALGRFRGHPTASQAILDMAKSDDAPAAADALRILTECQYILEPEFVQKLLNSEHSTIRAAALRYVDHMQKPK